MSDSPQSSSTDLTPTDTPETSQQVSVSPRATPAQDTVEIQEAILKHEALPEAISEILHLMRTSKNEYMRYNCATYIANLYLERADARAKRETKTASDEIAIILAKTLRDTIPNAREIPVMEGRWHEVEHDAGKALVIGRDRVTVVENDPS
jgi:hypothetical protein